MGLIDIVLVTIIVLGAVGGFFKGFIRQLVSIAGFIFGFLAARALYQVVAEKMALYVTDTSMTVLQIVAFIGIWVVIPLVFALIASFLTRTVEMLSLGALNRFLGLALGGLKWVLIVGLFINVLDYIDHDNRLISRTKKENSMLYYPVKEIIGNFFPVVEKVADEYIYT